MLLHLRDVSRLRDTDEGQLLYYGLRVVQLLRNYRTVRKQVVRLHVSLRAVAPVVLVPRLLPPACSAFSMAFFKFDVGRIALAAHVISGIAMAVHDDDDCRREIDM